MFSTSSLIINSHLICMRSLCNTVHVAKTIYEGIFIEITINEWIILQEHNYEK